MTGAFYAYVNVTNDGSDDAEFQVGGCVLVCVPVCVLYWACTLY